MSFSFLAKHRKPAKSEFSIFFLFAGEPRTVCCSPSDCRVFCNNIKTGILDVVRDEGAAIVTDISAGDDGGVGGREKLRQSFFVVDLCLQRCCWCLFNKRQAGSARRLLITYKISKSFYLLTTRCSTMLSTSSAYRKRTACFRSIDPRSFANCPLPC
jgi:hypothetical protein